RRHRHLLSSAGKLGIQRANADRLGLRRHALPGDDLPVDAQPHSGADLLAILEPLATLRHVEHGQRVGRFALAAVTLIDSWLLVPTMFTMHYADMFYSSPPDDRPLAFPRTEMPAFWDFAYFSFTIAAACQTADVSTTHVSIRRVVILHEIVSFAFNVAILGFAINIT